ncbi:concanavalin A-like lectin/glucanase [Mycena floridula]|nr:concanavalin A-like lectin/glucanase [Mycena floridula]
MFSLVALIAPLLCSVVSASVLDARDGASQFHTLLDFSSVSPGQDVASFLSSKGFSISNYVDTSSTPIHHDYTSDNVAFGKGTLDMKVSAYTSGIIHGAEITTENTAKLGSVRVVYKSSATQGIVEGNFFYCESFPRSTLKVNDNQEIDFEMLTATTLTSSPDVPAGIWATNQPLVPNTDDTHVTVPLTFDPSTEFHEYRIDWNDTATTFYIDGIQQTQLTTNVPTDNLRYIFNVWSSGDPHWSAGPPTADSITQIKSIDLYQGYLPT